MHRLFHSIARVLLGASLAVGLCAVAIGQTPQDPQKPQPQPQLPVFRGGTNLVLVDAYPRAKDGHIIEGLTPNDFEVLEDGKPQKVEQFEFVRVEPVPENERRDPNTQDEMLKLAADPHNRVFVVLLDTYHVTMAGSKAMRYPLVNMLDRVLGPGDLFGMTTPKVPPSMLVLGRKLTSVEAQLAQTWPWGERDAVGNSEEEQFFNACFGVDPNSGQQRTAADGDAGRLLPQLLVDRWREDRTLQNLKDLVTHLGEMREARTIVMAVTGGWRLFREDHTLAAQGGKNPAGPPPIGVPPGGGPIGILNRDPSGMAPTSNKCNSELLRLAYLDDERVFMEIITLANRNNVVFYTITPDGLATSDARPGEMGLNFGPNAMLADMDHASARLDSAITLARETDGISVGRGDLRAGMSRIINDVSAYYLLGYYSTNPKADGKLRRIKVQVKQPNVEVAARRGYMVPTPDSVAKKAAAKAVIPPPPTAPAGVTDALKVLAKLAGDSPVIAAGAFADKNIRVVTEIASGPMEMGTWRDGATVVVTVTAADGTSVGTATARIDPGQRGALVSVPAGDSAGPWRVIAKVTGKEGTFEDLVDVRAPTNRLIGDPIVSRGNGSGRVVLAPAADFQFHRTERVHAEFSRLTELDQRSARLLDQRGRPVPVEPTLTEHDDAAGRPVLIVDLNLAPLAGGDYVVEVTAGKGTETEQRFLALRVVR